MKWDERMLVRKKKTTIQSGNKRFRSEDAIHKKRETKRLMF